MNWQDILSVVVPLAAFLGWIYSRIDRRFDEMKNDMKEMKTDFISLNTKVAVIESKLSDISTNVSHLMWHHQALPQKEIKEE